MLHENENPRYIRQTPLLSDEDYPPLTNRGVIDPSTPEVFSHIDYFSATYSEPVQERIGQPLGHWLGNDLFVMEREKKGVRHFRYSADLFPAGRLYWNDSGEGTGSYVVLSGEEWAMAKAWHKLTDDELLKRVARNANSITRIDFCTNISAGHPRDTVAAFLAGQAQTRIRRSTTIEQHGDVSGFTAYYGSTQSDKMLRVYDKAEQTKMLWDVLTRIELQVRKKPAKRLVKAMIQNGVKDTGKTAIREFCNFPSLDWFVQATESDTVHVDLTPAKQTSFMKWLNEQVYPAIEKRVKAGEHVSDIRQWSERVALLLDGKNEQAEECSEGD